ncbi:MAG TPA: DegT/DnrJ/EryC1/StrS family aminotransferase [Polyangiaceae bacterium]|nr:DegT/DnrJ/EryC1/StrS family aminotransferase [Polyangiaceae bacterium]
MIPCSNPQAQYLSHRGAIDRALRDVLESGHFILGPQVKAFEREFAAYIGASHAIGVASGTDALVVTLRALGIGPGHEVITTAHTAVATVAAIELSGATPVLADIEPRYFTLDPRSVEARITPRTRAVVPVHLYGQAAELGALGALARRHGLKVVEDCAQAHGARYDGRRLGSIGDAGCYSCYPTKNLGALGDAGVIVTSDAELAARCRKLREYGWTETRDAALPGLNSRLDEVQAAVLRVKLAGLDADNDRRRALARAYGERLAGSPFVLPSVRPGASHVYHLYVVRALERDRVLSRLKDHGILAGIHYAVPVHLQTAYRGRLPGSDALPETERAAREVLSLPMFPELDASAVDSVCEALRDISGVTAEAPVSEALCLEAG